MGYEHVDFSELTRLYHGTLARNVPGIFSKGFIPGCKEGSHRDKHGASGRDFGCTSPADPTGAVPAPKIDGKVVQPYLYENERVLTISGRACQLLRYQFWRTAANTCVHDQILDPRVIIRITDSEGVCLWTLISMASTFL